MALSLVAVSLSLKGQILIAPFNLTIAPGEIVTLMGPSGSGKSSLLSFVAGELEAPFLAQGEVRLGDRPLTEVPPEARNIGRLFQDDLLFPHLTVAENLLFGMPRHIADRRGMMRTALKRIEMEAFEHRAPHTLSGGQRSRVALMRALLAKPAAMLLDEPFNKFDSALRAGMRAYVFAHLLERRIPCLLVTHDRADAPPGGRVLAIRQAGEISDA